MSFSLNPFQKSDQDKSKHSDDLESFAKSLQCMQPNPSLSDMLNLNLNESHGFATSSSSYWNQRVGGGATISKPSHPSSLSEVNTSLETIDIYSSPSKSSPDSLRQLSGGHFFNDTRDASGNDDDVATSSETERHVTKLFVGNLPFGTTLAELLPIFKKFGPVDEKLSAVKHRDHYAFINFYNRSDAQIALQEINNSLFKDRYLRVQFSHSKQQFKSPRDKTGVLF